MHTCAKHHGMERALTNGMASGTLSCTQRLAFVCSQLKYVYAIPVPARVSLPQVDFRRFVNFPPLTLTLTLTLTLKTEN